jgi:hypothetical protein
VTLLDLLTPDILHDEYRGISAPCSSSGSKTDNIGKKVIKGNGRAPFSICNELFIAKLNSTTF